jgi:hypothetical protein
LISNKFSAAVVVATVSAFFPGSAIIGDSLRVCFLRDLFPRLAAPVNYLA